MAELLPTHWLGVKKHWRKYDASILDEWDSEPEPYQWVSVPIHLLRTHGYAIGATGSGKTTALHHFWNQDIQEGHSLVIFDLRGDQIAAALELIAGRIPPSRVKLFDLREKDRPLGFNPLYGAGESYFRALNVLAAIANENESFGVQLAETLRMALLLLAETGHSLPELEQLLTDEVFRNSLLVITESETLLRFWGRFNDLTPEKQAAYVAPVMNKVSLLLCTEGLRRTLGHPKPVDLGKHLNTPGTVTLVSLAVDELHGAARMMGSLFLSAICREIFARVNIPEAQRVSVRLYVDEFENFSMDDFESILAEGRRFKLSLFLANQTLIQLTPRMRSMILNNVGVKLFFRTGREDAEALSKDLTGDRKALNLADLPVGEAFLWHRQIEPTRIELSEPLLLNVGELSAQAQTFVRELREAVPPFEPRKLQGRVKKALPVSQSSPSLGDWL